MPGSCQGVFEHKEIVIVGIARHTELELVFQEEGLALVSPWFIIVDVEGIDPKVQAIRIGSTVGTRKRKDIVEVADKKKIRVLNRGGL